METKEGEKRTKTAREKRKEAKGTPADPKGRLGPPQNFRPLEIRLDLLAELEGLEANLELQLKALSPETKAYKNYEALLRKVRTLRSLLGDLALPLSLAGEVKCFSPTRIEVVWEMDEEVAVGVGPNEASA